MPSARCLGVTRSARFGALALAAVAAGSAPLVMPGSSPARSQSIAISPSGAIGALRLNASTAAAVRRRWGAPSHTTTGNVMGGARSGYPDFRLLGYDCQRRGPATSCAVDFYISLRTGRLESFSTTSGVFRLFGGVRVGMRAGIAARREHGSDMAGCLQGIFVRTPSLSVEISTTGGHIRRRREGDSVSGGRVSGIGIDENPYGVGVLFC